MVLESLTNPIRAQKHPFAVLLLGLAYGTIAIFLALWIFEEQASMVMVFLGATATVPLMYHMLSFEEKKDVLLTPQKSLIHEHAGAMIFYMMLFIGMSLAFSFWYVALPTDLATDVFRVQSQTISNLNQHVTGNITQTALLSNIFLNNVKVMIFCILFSFLYGSGAIFILTWNASVIGAAAGNFMRSHMAKFVDAVGIMKVGAYFYVSSLTVLRYAIHGIPEILAYVVAALAGGILSMAIVHHDVGTDKFENVLLDVSDLVLLGVFILFVAALIEVFITPALF